MGVVRRWSGWWEIGTGREEQDRLACGKSSGATRDKTTSVGREFVGAQADILGGGGGVRQEGTGILSSDSIITIFATVEMEYLIPH